LIRGDRHSAATLNAHEMASPRAAQRAPAHASIVHKRPANSARMKNASRISFPRFAQKSGFGEQR
jgi:hypothetical protein